MLVKIFHSVIESLIRNISGGLGQRIRYTYYSRRFKSCGINVKIDEGVIIQNPENMVIGNNVWFLAFSIITARATDAVIANRIEKKIQNNDFSHKVGELIIGDEVAIGNYSIIFGYGGLEIQNRVTTSARVAIYSYSHYPYDENDRRKVTYANSMVKSNNIACIESPIVIQEGAWLGYGVTVLGGTVGKNSFVTTNSVVVTGVKDNGYASGNPAVVIKDRFE